MGFFSGIKAAARKSEAAVVIEKLLDQQITQGFIRTEPRALANKLVEVVWERNPKLFNNEKLPHKLVLAAAALSSGVNALKNGDHSDQLALASCLGFVLMELTACEGVQPLSQLDFYLIENATAVHVQFYDKPSTTIMLKPR
jgi:hypothetical protein